MLPLLLVVLCVRCCLSDTQERAPLYVFEAEEDVYETYGATSGIAIYLYLPVASYIYYSTSL